MRPVRMLVVALAAVGVMTLGVNTMPSHASNTNAAHAFSLTSSTVPSVANTSGDLYRFIPSGIDPNNDARATAQVIAYANQNPDYAQALASQTGASRFRPSDYKPDGYRAHAPFGSTNSAASGMGQVVGVADHGDSAMVKVVAVVNIHTGGVAYVMVRCGNLRLFHVIPIPWKPIHIGVMKTINRNVTKHRSITCPSGQTVAATLTVHVRGVVYGKTYGQVQGQAKIWLNVHADIKITATLKLRCNAQPAPAPPVLKQPIVIGKTCVDPNNNVETCPTNTFHFTVVADGAVEDVVYNPAPGANSVTAQLQCTPGSTVQVTEQAVSGWNLIFPTANPQYVPCTSTGAFASFKNQEQRPSSPSPPSSSPPPAPKSNTDYCTNIPGEQTAVPAGYQRNSDGTCTYVGP